MKKNRSRDLTVRFSFRSSSKWPALTQYFAQASPPPHKNIPKNRKTQKNKILSNTFVQSYAIAVDTRQVIPGLFFSYVVAFSASKLKRDGGIKISHISHRLAPARFKDYGKKPIQGYSSIQLTSHRFKCFLKIRTHRWWK